MLMNASTLLEELTADFREALQPPTGKADRGFVPPEIVQLIAEKVLVSILASIVLKVGSAAWDWWKRQGTDLDEIKGRPTIDLAAQSQPILGEMKSHLVTELDNASVRELNLPDRAELI